MKMKHCTHRKKTNTLYRGINDSYKLVTQFEFLIYYNDRNEIYRWQQDKPPAEDNETEGIHSATNFQLKQIQTQRKSSQ